MEENGKKKQTKTNYQEIEKIKERKREGGKERMKNLSKGTINTVTRKNDGIFRESAPFFKQFAGQTTLQHTRGSHNNTRARFIKLLNGFEIMDVLKVKRIGNIRFLAYFFIHDINKRLIDGHTLLGQGRSIVNGNIVKLLFIFLPKIVQDQQQLLRRAQGEHRNQAISLLMQQCFFNDASEDILTL